MMVVIKAVQSIMIKDMGIIILSVLAGMWIAIILGYFMIIKPTVEENENLKEIIHQQTKIGFYHDLKQDEYE